MRTHEAKTIPCALVQPLPTDLNVSPHIASSACNTSAHATVAGNVYDIRTRITHIDRAIIRGYFQEHCRPSVIGSVTMRTPARDSQWPQTPEECLRRGSHANSLPAALEDKLTALPAGYQRVLVDDDVALVNSATREIVDVMRHARTSAGPTQPDARDRDHFPGTVNRPGGCGRDRAARWRLCERVGML